MTNATLAFAVALLGWAPLIVLLARRLRSAEKDIAMLLRNASHQSRDIGTAVHVAADLRVTNDRLSAAVADLSANERTFALDLARTADDLTDLRGEYLAQARALDAHDERLQALETPKETV